MIGQNFQSPDVQQAVIAQRIRERAELSGRKRFSLNQRLRGGGAIAVGRIGETGAFSIQ